MPLDTTVKVGAECRVFLSSAAQPLLSIDTADVATELGSVAAMAWEEVGNGFLRYPFTRTEPQDVVDIYKRFDIDHTKRGKEQRKTGSMATAFTNTGNILRKYKNVNALIKVEWHPNDQGAVDEYEYLNNVRFTSLVREVPDGEAMERGDFVWADWGHRTGP